ncbi:hypothetical protein LIA77_00579 [Sarocladium implicatum]|nr:hypothetical protein LIA77_00579 [Sarocladium implicatum]
MSTRWTAAPLCIGSAPPPISHILANLSKTCPRESLIKYPRKTIRAFRTCRSTKAMTRLEVAATKLLGSQHHCNSILIMTPKVYMLFALMLNPFATLCWDDRELQWRVKDPFPPAGQRMKGDKHWLVTSKRDGGHLHFSREMRTVHCKRIGCSIESKFADFKGPDTNEKRFDEQLG